MDSQDGTGRGSSRRRLARRGGSGRLGPDNGDVVLGDDEPVHPDDDVDVHDRIQTSASGALTPGGHHHHRRRCRGAPLGGLRLLNRRHRALWAARSHHSFRHHRRSAHGTDHDRGEHRELHLRVGHHHRDHDARPGQLHHEPLDVCRCHAGHPDLHDRHGHPGRPDCRPQPDRPAQHRFYVPSQCPHSRQRRWRHRPVGHPGDLHRQPGRIPGHLYSDRASVWHLCQRNGRDHLQYQTPPGLPLHRPSPPTARPAASR